MVEPILRATACPEEIMPRNCRSALKQAVQNGWETDCTIAIGTPDDTSDYVRSILLRARKGAVRLAATWEGPPNGSSPGFARARRHCPEGFKFLNYGEFLEALTGEEKSPTKVEQEKLYREADVMLQSIQAVAVTGYPTAVIAQGSSGVWCDGKVRVGLYWMPCGRPAAAGMVLCDGDCADALLMK